MKNLKLFWQFFNCSFYETFYKELDPALARRHALAASCLEDHLVDRLEDGKHERIWVAVLYLTLIVAVTYLATKEISKVALFELLDYSLT